MERECAPLWLILGSLVGGCQLDLKYRSPFRLSHNLGVLIPVQEWLFVLAKSSRCLRGNVSLKCKMLLLLVLVVRMLSPIYSRSMDLMSILPPAMSLVAAGLYEAVSELRVASGKPMSLKVICIFLCPVVLDGKSLRLYKIKGDEETSAAPVKCTSIQSFMTSFAGLLR